VTVPIACFTAALPVTCAGWAVRPRPHTSFVEGGSGATSSGWNIGAIGVAATGAAYLAKSSKRQKHPRKDMPLFIFF